MFQNLVPPVFFESGWRVEVTIEVFIIVLVVFQPIFSIPHHLWVSPTPTSSFPARSDVPSG
jgi:hypothetical protein